MKARFHPCRQEQTEAKHRKYNEKERISCGMRSFFVFIVGALSLSGFLLPTIRAR